MLLVYSSELMATIIRGKISSVQELARRAGDAPASVKTDGQWGDTAGLHSLQKTTPVSRGLKDQCVIPNPGERSQMTSVVSTVGASMGCNSPQVHHLVLHLLSTLVSKNCAVPTRLFHPAAETADTDIRVACSSSSCDSYVPCLAFRIITRHEWKSL